MTTYLEYSVMLTPNQKSKLMRAIRNKSEITLRLKHSQLCGSDELMLTNPKTDCKDKKITSKWNRIRYKNK